MNEELLALIASVRPNGIEPAAYQMVIELVLNYVKLQYTRPKE